MYNSNFYLYLSFFHLIIQEPQESPTPKPDKNKISLLLILPFLSASFKANGIVDETVLPNNFRLLKIFSFGKLRASPKESKISLLPWWKKKIIYFLFFDF